MQSRARSPRRLLGLVLGTSLLLVMGLACDSGTEEATPTPETGLGSDAAATTPTVAPPTEAATPAGTPAGTLGGTPLGTPVPTPVGTPAGTPAGSPGLDLLQRSQEKMAEVETARLTMTMNMEMAQFEMPGAGTDGTPAAPATPQVTPSQDGSVLMEGEIDFGREGRTHFRMMVVAEGEAQSLDVIMIPPDEAYVNEPTLGWIKVNPANAQEIIGTMGADQSLFEAPFTTAETPWELFDVQVLGTDTTDDVPVTRVSYSFDFEEVWAQLSEEERVELLESMGPAGQMGMTEEMVQAVTLDRLEVWIDDQGFQRRTIMDMTVEGMATMTMDVTARDLNEDIEVSPPESFIEMPQ